MLIPLNLILFNLEEVKNPLPKEDPRAEHILKVLRILPGQTFDVGEINGRIGQARLEEAGKAFLKLSFWWTREAPPLFPIDLWVSYCRPQTCRRILQECTSMGVRSITFFNAEKSEPSYRESRLWKTGEAEHLLIRGAEQAFCTRLPELRYSPKLQDLLADPPQAGSTLALDNYESTQVLGTQSEWRLPITVAVGGERGWSAGERNELRGAGFTLVDLGQRVLRTETACIAAISILRSHIIH